MARVIVIAEDYTDDDLFRNVVAEVNDDAGMQYSRTPFKFLPGTDDATADAEIVSVLSPYLEPGDPHLITR